MTDANTNMRNSFAGLSREEFERTTAAPCGQARHVIEWQRLEHIAKRSTEHADSLKKVADDADRAVAAAKDALVSAKRAAKQARKQARTRARIADYDRGRAANARAGLPTDIIGRGVGDDVPAS
jgi:hypothetical protein